MPKSLEFSNFEERVFVDRCESQKEFIDAYNACNCEDDYNIICFFGDGGIGKSELFNTLQDNLKYNRCSSSVDSDTHPISNKPVPYVTYDLGDSSSCDAVRILTRLRNKFSNKLSFQFPLYDLTYIEYLSSRGDESNLITADKIQTILGKNHWLENVLDFAAGVNNYLGILKPLINSIDTIKNLPEQFQEKAYKKDAKDFIRIIEQSEEKPEELKKLLSIAFSKDLKWNCKRKLDKPLVILLDTFEAYQNYLNNYPSEKDWLKEVITHSANTLYVLLGRNKCPYTENNKSLDNFDLKFTTDLMVKKGVKDEEIINAVNTITGGLPYYINICISNYRHLIDIGQKPDINSIGATTSEMNQRYYKYLDDAEKKIVEIASLLGVFSREDLLICSKDLFDKSFSESKCENVITECIVKRIDENNYKVHDIAKKVFLENAKKNKNSYFPEMLHSVIKLQASKISNIKVPSSIPLGIVNNCYDNVKQLIQIETYELQKDDASAMDDLAVCFSRICDIDSLQKAKELDEKVLEIRTKLLGKENPDTLNSMYRLGIDYSYLGDKESLSKALKLDEETLELRNRFLGVENSDTLKSMRALACDYTRLGDKESLQKAKLLDEKVYKTQRRILGEDNPETLRTLSNLAVDYSAIGDKENLLKSFKLAKEVYAKRKDTLGAEHPDTLLSMNHLANAYSDLGGNDNLQNAIKLEEEALAINKKVSGEEHPHTLRATGILANLYLDLGDKDNLKKSLELKEKSLEIYTKVLGEEHPDTLQAMDSLAISYTAFGDKSSISKAITIGTEAVEKLEKVLGEENLTTLAAMGNLANRYSDLGDRKNIQKAIELNNKVLIIRKRLLGRENPDTLLAMANLASDYYNLGGRVNIRKAIMMNENVFKMRKEVLGEEHLSTLISMGDLATNYSALGDKESVLKAISLHEEELITLKKLFGEEHPTTLLTMSNLAAEYPKLGGIDNLLKAKKLDEEVFETRKKVLGEKHPSSLVSMYNLAYDYAKIGDKESLAEAIELFRDNIKLREQVLGETHPDTQISIRNLAVAYYNLGGKENLLKAIELYKRLGEINLKLYGENNKKTQDANELIRQIQKELAKGN